MKIYRFKTEQEFIEEFGNRWHNKVYQTWESEGNMDYLFGQEISQEFYNKVVTNPNKTAKLEYSGLNEDYEDVIWSISPDMVKEEELVISPDKVIGDFIKDILDA